MKRLSFSGFFILIFWNSCLISTAALTRTEKQFDAVLIVSNDRYFQTKWNYCPDITEMEISTFDLVYHGETVNLYLLLRDIMFDNKGQCNISYDLDIFNPSGGIYLSRHNICALKTINGTPSRIILASNSFKFYFQNSDPKGKYSIRIKVYDHLSGKNVSTGNEITLANYGSDPELSESQLINRIARYYQKPDSHQAINLFKVVFSVEKLQGTGDYAYKMASFFQAVFKENSYLLPYLIEYVNNLEFENRQVIHPILKRISIDYPGFLNDLLISGEERQSIKKIDYPDLWDQNFTSIKEIDMLWLNFYATGDFRPVRQIVNAVSLLQKKDSNSFVIGNEAVKTLTKNCREHLLVKKYCYAIYRQEKQDEFTRQELGKCLYRMK